MSVRRVLLAAAAIAVAGCAFLVLGLEGSEPPPPIRVGILHSLTGFMGPSETEVFHATLLAIDEVNAAGGLLGRRVEAIEADGRSDWPTFAREAENLISRDEVRVIFGCWTSASRKSVRPVVEKHDHLLFYPVQYEGVEQSPNIVYTGAAPNQQLLPGVQWAFRNLGRRFFLVGSDYVYPRTANAILRDLIVALGGEILGDEYVLLDSDDVGGVVDQIVATKPDVILNNLVGPTNRAFFRQLRARGIASRDTPTLSFGFGEPELRTMDVTDLQGDYAAWNYFQSVATPENEAFVAAYRAHRARHGDGTDHVTSDPMEAAYSGVHLWARAVAEAGTDDPKIIRHAIRGQSWRAPGGMVSVDAMNLHTWKTARVGRIRHDGQFEIVWDSGRPVRPVPYPIFRNRSEWDASVEALRTGWGGAWANPGR